MEAAQDVVNYMRTNHMAFTAARIPPGAIVYLQQNWKPPPQGRELTMIWNRARKMLFEQGSPTRRFEPGPEPLMPLRQAPRELPMLPPPVPTAPVAPPAPAMAVPPPPRAAMPSEPEKRPTTRGRKDYKDWLDIAATDALGALGSMTIAPHIVEAYLKKRWKPRPKPAEVQAVNRRLQAQMIVSALRGLPDDQQREYVRKIGSKRLKALVRSMLKEQLVANPSATPEEVASASALLGGASDQENPVEALSIINPRGRRRYPAQRRSGRAAREYRHPASSPWNQWKWAFIHAYQARWGHEPRDEGYRSRDYYPLFEAGMTPEQAAEEFGRGHGHTNNPQPVHRTVENTGKYYVHIPASRAEGLKAKDHGPYPLEQAKSFARIGSQKGRPRVIFRGTGKRAKKIRRYKEGKRVFPTKRAQLRGFKPEERPREL
jgi:hypothetical protein